MLKLGFLIGTETKFRMQKVATDCPKCNFHQSLSPEIIRELNCKPCRKSITEVPESQQKPVRSSPTILRNWVQIR